MPNIYLHYAAWDQLPAEVQGFLIDWMGDKAGRGRAFYELYFYWYNIAHELGHVLRTHYGRMSGSQWTEETAVNEFAVAYWRARGEAERLARLRAAVEEALSRMADPAPAGEDRAAYFDAHPHELITPPAYGHYQFNMVRAALDRPRELGGALQALINPQAGGPAPQPAPPYAALDADLPQRIADDMRAYLAPLGVALPPVQTVCAYAPALQFVTWE